MKYLKDSISKPSVFRQIAESFFIEKKAISTYFDYMTDSRHKNLWYHEMYCSHSELLEHEMQQIKEGEYGYLGDDGVVLFLLFLAEYEENP
jgi:hypothetical protein